jgi:hypothetical protein
MKVLVSWFGVSAAWTWSISFSGTSGSFLDVDNLYPTPGVHTHHHPQVFFPLKVSRYPSALYIPSAR